MSNIIKVIQDKTGNNVFPLTHEKAVRDSAGVSLDTKLSALKSKTYIEAWDGASTPVVANIPAGVVVSYNGSNYTGTLAASSSTDGKIYLVKDGTEYDRYASTINLGGTYIWSYLGTTAMSLSGYATEEELKQLDQRFVESKSAGSESDLDVTDENDFILARFEKGHIKTKNFDSEAIQEEIKSFLKKGSTDKMSDLDIVDEDGFILARFEEGHIKTKNFDSSKASTTNKVGSGLDIDMGLPLDVPKVYIRSESLHPDTSNNTIPPLSYSGTNPGNPVGDVDTDEVTLEFVSGTVNFTDNIELNYQGATSLADPKKGFGIDTHDKHKFGKWVECDSFHLKAFYEDFIKCRDWVCNRLMEQVYMSRPAEQQRPFLLNNNFNNDYRSFWGGNALCHVDGFPVELYINDIYWGLYIWRLKKDRSNYLFTKGDAQHIFLDAQDWFTNQGAFQWNGVEVRNPKTLYCVTVKDGAYTKYDGDNPTELIDSTMEYYDPENPGHVLTNLVKQSIVAWKDFMWGITVSTSKESIAQHLSLQDFIDCYLLMEVCNVWDSWARNTLYGSWDGQHFAPMLYDMNNSFNGFGGKNSGTYQAYYPPTSEPYNEKARRMSWFVALETILASDIKARYHKLQELGIFTAENIVGMFDRFALWVGFNAYGREVERWPNIPSYVGDNRDIDQIAILKQWIEERIDYLNSKYI